MKNHYYRSPWTPTTCRPPWGRCKRPPTHIDVIEVGTILCLAEGMHAVRVMRSLFPDKIVLADVRIAEAGSIISKMAFDAGADWVSVVSGAAPELVRSGAGGSAVRAGKMCRLSSVTAGRGKWPKHWADMGVQQVIFKRSRDAGSAGRAELGRSRDFDMIRRLHEMGFKVTVTGGVKVTDIPAVSTACRSISLLPDGPSRGAEDPAAAAQAFQRPIAQTFA